jgi:ribosome-binding factor A
VRRTNPRPRRVAEQIQRELSGLIRLDLDDPRVGLVTITDVEVTGDLAHAKVFFTVLGAPSGPSPDTRAALGAGTHSPVHEASPTTAPDRDQISASASTSSPTPTPTSDPRADTLAGLQRAAGFLRAQLGHRLLLRSVPQLHFIYDESVERGVHLSQLIDRANDSGSPS